jgi:hypothetical protein
MNMTFVAGAVALAMTTVGAVAQTSQTTTTVAPMPVVPSPVAPPDGTLSVTRSQKTIAADGSQTNCNQTTYRKSNGVADDSVTTTATVPPPLIMSTTRSTTTITR